MPVNFKINLESLVELSGRLTSTFDESFILNSVLLSIMGKLRVFRACIYRPDAESRKFLPVLCKGKGTPPEIPFIEMEGLIESAKHNLPDGFASSGFSFFLPVIFQGKTIALITLGEKISGSGLLKTEIQYANLVAGITANALQNTMNHNSLLQSKNLIELRNQLLTTLFEMSKDFSTLLTKSEILKILSFRLMGQMMVSRFAVILKSNSLDFDIIINRFEKPIPENVIYELFAVSDTCMVGKCKLPECACSLIEDIDARVISSMMIQGVPKGLLIVGKKMNGEEFSSQNMNFIEALGNLAISALETERLFQEEVEKKKLENEMELALDIQKNLLPKKFPDIGGYEFFGTSIPSRLVGGDYFDFISIGDNRVLVAIADVSGKGMPAALLMANAQASLRTLSSLDISLSEIIIRLNRIVYENTSADKFVTFFCGILDCSTGNFKYINAGHNPPLWFKSNGSIVPLTEGGIILGILELPMPYFENEIVLSDGDTIVLYTDGVTEAPDGNGREYSEDRLKKSIHSHYRSKLTDLLESIVHSVQKHSEGISQFDDITISAVRKY